LRVHLLALAASLGLALAPRPARADGPVLAPFVDLETGAVLTGRHDARAGAGGTAFSLVSGGDFQAAPAPLIRLAGGADLGRHTVFLSFAPLWLDGNGASGAALQFRGVPFTASGGASYRYRLDAFRLVYRYALLDRPSLSVSAGAGALLRVAELRLSQPGQTSVGHDLGLLPIASLRAAWRFAGDFGAAAGRRSEDVSLALEFTSGELVFRAGYRVVEGGLDAARFRDLVLFHHLLAGVSYRF
jgi:hypothetical protein